MRGRPHSRHQPAHCHQLGQDIPRNRQAARGPQERPPFGSMQNPQSEARAPHRQMPCGQNSSAVQVPLCLVDRQGRAAAYQG